MDEVKQEVFDKESSDIGKKINPIPKPPVNIGIDTDNEFYDNLVGAGIAEAIDIGELNNFAQISQSRETL